MPEPQTVRELIVKYLQEQGYDGLVYDRYCACALDEWDGVGATAAPCLREECKFAMRLPDKEGKLVAAEPFMALKGRLCDEEWYADYVCAAPKRAAPQYEETWGFPFQWKEWPDVTFMLHRQGGDWWVSERTTGLSVAGGGTPRAVIEATWAMCQHEGGLDIVAVARELAATAKKD